MVFFNEKQRKVFTFCELTITDLFRNVFTIGIHNNNFTHETMETINFIKSKIKRTTNINTDCQEETGTATKRVGTRRTMKTYCKNERTRKEAAKKTNKQKETHHEETKTSASGKGEACRETHGRL